LKGKKTASGKDPTSVGYFGGCHVSKNRGLSDRGRPAVRQGVGLSGRRTFDLGTAVKGHGDQPGILSVGLPNFAGGLRRPSGGPGLDRLSRRTT